MPGAPSDKQPIRDINATAAQILALCWAVCLAQNYIAWKAKREGDVGTFDASFLLIIVGALVMVWRCTQSDSSLRKLLRRLGVARSRLRKAVSEIEVREVFLMTLFLDLTYRLRLACCAEEDVPPDWARRPLHIKCYTGVGRCLRPWRKRRRSKTFLLPFCVDHHSSDLVL